jgi:hypothetical protein
LRLLARSLSKGRKEVGTGEKHPVDKGADNPSSGIEGPRLWRGRRAARAEAWTA